MSAYPEKILKSIGDGCSISPKFAIDVSGLHSRAACREYARIPQFKRRSSGYGKESEMRRRTTFLTLAGVAVVAIAVAAPSSIRNTKSTPITPTADVRPVPTNLPEQQGTIDGAVNPELIPDDVAYSLFLNFLAAHQSPDHKNSMKSYFKYHPQLNGIDVETLMRVAEEFQAVNKAIDDDERALATAGYQKGSSVGAKMALIKQRRLSLVNGTVAALPNRIGKDAAEAVKRHVMDYIKRKVKIGPPPPMPPMN